MLEKHFVVFRVVKRH